MFYHINNETLELEVREMTKEITDLVNPKEFESFADSLVELCEFLLNEIDTETFINSPLSEMNREFLLMPFWANTAIIYLHRKNKKSKYHNLIFAICKMIYINFKRSVDKIFK